MLKWLVSLERFLRTLNRKIFNKIAAYEKIWSKNTDHPNHGDYSSALPEYLLD